MQSYSPPHDQHPAYKRLRTVPLQSLPYLDLNYTPFDSDSEGEPLTHDPNTASSSPGLEGGRRGEDLKMATSSFAFASSLQAIAFSAAAVPTSASFLLRGKIDLLMQLFKNRLAAKEVTSTTGRGASQKATCPRENFTAVVKSFYTSTPHIPSLHLSNDVCRESRTGCQIPRNEASFPAVAGKDCEH